MQPRSIIHLLSERKNENYTKCKQKPCSWAIQLTGVSVASAREQRTATTTATKQADVLLLSMYLSALDGNMVTEGKSFGSDEVFVKKLLNCEGRREKGIRWRKAMFFTSPPVDCTHWFRTTSFPITFNRL